MLLGRTVPALAFWLTLAALACSSTSSSTATDYAGACAKLASKCHGSTSTVGKECHDLGHDGTDATCGPRVSECLAECAHDDSAAESDAGASEATGDAGSGAATDGGASAECAAYCACMTSTCATRPTYPYHSERACLTACGTFTAAGLTCVSAACERAKVPADTAHECDHAGTPLGCHGG